MKVAVCIPAYRAAASLPDVVARIPDDLRASIIVVDDGSPDDTYEVARQLPDVTALRHERNRGYGGAQKTLYDAALSDGADVIVMMHSDGGHRPEELHDVLGPVLEGRAELVVGARILGILGDVPATLSRAALARGHAGPMPTHIFIANLMLSRIQNLCYGTNYASFHDGFRAVTADALTAIPYRALGSGWLYDTEFMVAAHERGFDALQVPVATIYEPGTSAWARNLRYGRDILLHALRYRFGRRRTP